ncbi:MAG: ATP-binding protein [Polyangia bacterium]
MKPEINLDALREVLGATAVIRTMERELVKPQVNTAAIWKYFTTSVYTSGDLVSIATREALQNGLDAVRAAQKQGQLRKGEGWFDASWDAERGALSWEDNGIGMDRDTVRDKFLSLGDSGKAAAADSQQAAGGFGVAKAVILGLSEHFEWDLHTRDVLATSRRSQDIELRSATERRGTRITVFSLPSRLINAYSQLTGQWDEIPARLRMVLAVCDLPELELRLDGKRVEPAFARRGGAVLAEAASWGPGTTARVRAFRRADRRGSFWVRLGGLFQFAKSSYTKLPADVVVDLATTHRPGSLDYPLTASRDQLQGEARQALESLIRRVEQENESAGRSEEYEVLLPEGQSPLAADTTAALEAPELRSALQAAGAALRANLLAELTQKRVAEQPTSRAPGRNLDGPEELDGAPGLLSKAELLATGLMPKDLAQALAPGDGFAQGVYREALDRLAAGTADAEDIGQLERAAGRLAETASAPGGGGLLALAAAQEALAVLPAAKRGALSPFGAMAGVRVSKKNFDARRAAAFKRGFAKWVPYLLVWDASLRLVAAQGRIERAFRPGFVLDDSVNGMAALEKQNGRKVAVVYVHPFTFEAQVKAHRERPLVLAYWIHSLACHELTHLDGRMDEGHSESFMVHREALGRETSALLPAIAELAVTLLGLPSMGERQREMEQRAWRLIEAAQRELAARSSSGKQVAAWFRRNRPLLQLVVKALSQIDK